MVSTTSPFVPMAPAQTLSVPGTPPLELRVWGKKPRGGAVPLVLHFHGGAFVSGDLDSGACLAGLLASSGAVVASLAYPLAPAHRFPDAVEAGYAALEGLDKQGTPLAGSAPRPVPPTRWKPVTRRWSGCTSSAPGWPVRPRRCSSPVKRPVATLQPRWR